MALENPALNECSFQRGIEEADAETRSITVIGAYPITGVLLLIMVAALEVSSEGVRNKITLSRARREGELGVVGCARPTRLGALSRLDRDRQNGKG